jgi:hypothetical protein
MENFSLKIFSEYRKHYLGNQFLPEKMGNLEIGPKETTGPVRNENGYIQTFDDPRRFITTYQIKYLIKKKNFISFINTFFSPKVILIQILKDVIVKVMLLVVYKNHEQVVLLKIQKQQIH